MVAQRESLRSIVAAGPSIGDTLVDFVVDAGESRTSEMDQATCCRELVPLDAALQQEINDLLAICDDADTFTHSLQKKHPSVRHKVPS